MIEFQDASGGNWDGFVSNDPAYYEYAHTPPYDWHTYFNWFDRGGTWAGVPVRWKPKPQQTEVHYIFLYEHRHCQRDPGQSACRSGKGCYIDDLVLDAVPDSIPVETVGPDGPAPVDVANLAALKAKPVGMVVRLTEAVIVTW